LWRNDSRGRASGESPEALPDATVILNLTPQKNSADWDAKSARFRGHPKIIIHAF
jgi:hypothetical protein